MGRGGRCEETGVGWGGGEDGMGRVGCRVSAALVLGPHPAQLPEQMGVGGIEWPLSP